MSIFICTPQLALILTYIGRFGRESSSSGPDLTSHFSVSLDYGADSPLSVDQISFNSLKDRGEEKLEVRSPDQQIGFSGSISFQEAVGKASDSVMVLSYRILTLNNFTLLQEPVCTGFNLAEILDVAT